MADENATRALYKVLCFCIVVSLDAIGLLLSRRTASCPKMEELILLAAVVEWSEGNASCGLEPSWATAQLTASSFHRVTSGCATSECCLVFVLPFPVAIFDHLDDTAIESY